MNLKALLFASAAALAMGAVSAPAFADSGYNPYHSSVTGNPGATPDPACRYLTHGCEVTPEGSKHQDTQIETNRQDLLNHETRIKQNNANIEHNWSDINHISDRDPKTGKAITAHDSVARKQAKAALTGDADDQTARDGVAANAEAINQANQNIANAGAAARSYTDQMAANTLKQANQYTDSRYNQLNGKVDKLRSRVDSGVAGATALASIPFSSLTKNSFGGSVAVANSKAAGSVGYQRNFNQRWSARGTVAFGDHYTQGGIGGSYNW